MPNLVSDLIQKIGNQISEQIECMIFSLVPYRDQTYRALVGGLEKVRICSLGDPGHMPDLDGHMIPQNETLDKPDQPNHFCKFFDQ